MCSKFKTKDLQIGFLEHNPPLIASKEKSYLKQLLKTEKGS